MFVLRWSFRVADRARQTRERGQVIVLGVHGVGFGLRERGLGVVDFELRPDAGPVAQAMLTYGQSTDPKSPWYADQVQVFSRKEWPVLPFTAAKIKADPNYTTATLKE